MVAERSISAEAKIVRSRGVYGSENVGMSNLNGSEKLPNRKSKVFDTIKLSIELVGT